MSDQDHDRDYDPANEMEEDEVTSTSRHVSCLKNVWCCSNWEPSELVAYRERHLSSRPLSGMGNFDMRTYSGRGIYMNIFSPLMITNKRQEFIWRHSGLSLYGECIAELKKIERPRMLVLGLLEWWWDTTNTFHFPWGEMTITPLDFMMVTGFSFTKKTVEVNMELRFGDPRVENLLGPIASQIDPTANMRTVCRVRSSSTRVSCLGAWRIIEYWAYEYLPKLAPECPTDVFYPAITAWEVRCRQREPELLDKTRKAIQHMERHEVNIRPWGDLEVIICTDPDLEDIAALEHAHFLTRSRQIF